MMANTAAGHDLASVHEIEIDVHCGGRNEQHARHIPGALMGAAVLVLARVGVTYPGRQGLRGQ